MKVKKRISLFILFVVALAMIVYSGLSKEEDESYKENSSYNLHNSGELRIQKSLNLEDIEQDTIKYHLSYVLIGMLMVVSLNYFLEYILVKGDLSNFYLGVLFLVFAGHIFLISPWIINVLGLSDIKIFKIHIISEILAITLLGTYIECSLRASKYLRNQTRQLLNLMFILLVGFQSELSSLMNIFYIWNIILLVELSVQFIGPYKECNDKVRVIFTRIATAIWALCILKDIVIYYGNTENLSNHRRYGYAVFLTIVIILKIKNSKEWKVEIKESKDSLEEIVLEKSSEALTSKIELLEVNEKLKESIKELKEKEELLIKSEKLAVLGEFAGEITHEIKNPLSAIISSVSLLKEEVEELEISKRKDIEESIEIIDEASKKAKEIIMNILNYSRMETNIALEEVEVSKIIKSVYMLSSRNLEKKGIEFWVDQNEKLKVMGKTGELTQVILNIINNCRDAIEEKGVEKGKIELKAYKDSGKVIIEIIDNGIGMTDEERGNMTKAYFTTKEEGKGTGLGMSISYQILERHNARLYVDSKKGLGSKFKIVFDLVN